MGSMLNYEFKWNPERRFVLLNWSLGISSPCVPGSVDLFHHLPQGRVTLTWLSPCRLKEETTVHFLLCPPHAEGAQQAESAFSLAQD